MTTLPKHIDARRNSVVNAASIVVDQRFIGRSSRAVMLKRAIAALAPTNSPILIQGPTGSGKDVVAHAAHAASGRVGDFIAINCAAIPAELLESELFGHEKGSFTGADAKRVGLIEMAQGGTLFLDEIGDMPLALQAKLLRVIETRQFRRVGGKQDVTVDFRLICATHRNIDELVKAGEFREDLKFRISVFPVQVPSLAERAGDIPLLIEYLTEQLAEQNMVSTPPIFGSDALRILANYDWPGNVRELRNVVERALVFFPASTITAAQVVDNLLHGVGHPIDIADDYEDVVTIGEGKLPDPLQFRGVLSVDQKMDIRGYLRDIEAELISSAVANCDGNVSSAADTLGLQRTTLIEKMKKMGIER